MRYSILLISALLASSLVVTTVQQAQALTAVTTTNKGTITDSNPDWSLSGSIWSTSTDTYIVTAEATTYNIYRYNHATATLTSDTGNTIAHRGITTWTNPAVASSTATIVHYDDQTHDSSVGESAINIAIAEKIAAGSILEGAKIDQIDLWIGDTSAPSAGVIQIGTFDSAGTLLCNFGTEDFTSLADYPPAGVTTKTLAAGTFCTLSAGQYIGFKITTAFVSGSATIGLDTASSYDGTNSVRARFNGASWADTTTEDVNLTVKTIEGDYLMNDDVTTNPNYWKNNVDSEAGANFYVNLGSSKTIHNVDLYMQTASEIPSQIELTVSADTTFNETPVTCNLSASAGLQNCIINNDAGQTGQYVEFLVSNWGSATRWRVNEVDVSGNLNVATANGMASNIDTDGDFYVMGQVVSGTSMVAMEVNVDGTIQNTVFTSSIGADLRSIRDVEMTKNRVWFHGVVEASTSDNHFFGSYDRNLGDYIQEDDLGGDCSDISGTNSFGMSVVEGATGADDRAYAIALTDTSVIVLCWDETDITNGETSTSIGTSGTSQLELVSLNNGKLLAWGDDDLWEITTPGHVLTQVRTTYPTTFITQTHNQTDAGRTYFSTPTAYISDATGDSEYYTPSTGAISTAPAIIETADAGGQELVSESAAKYYRIGDIAILTATSTSATTWTFEALPSMQTVSPNPYTELVGTSLIQNDTIGTIDVIQIQCDTGTYTIPNADFEVDSYSDCDGWRVLADSSASVGRELPFSATSDLVHAGTFTGYTIVLTDSSTPDAYYIKSIYDTKTVDQAEFDSGASAQQRYLYGQCYTMQIINENTDEQVLVGDLCANDITEKEISLSGSVVGNTVPITGQLWQRTWTLGDVIGGVRNINYTVTTSQLPFNVSLWVTDALDENEATIAVWHNYTNANPLAELAMTNIYENQTLYIRGYSNDTLQFSDVIAGNPIGDIENPFEFLGTLGGIPFIVLIGLPIMATIFTKKYEIHAIILVMIVTGVMYAIGWLPFLDPVKFALIIVIGGIGIFAARRSEYG